MYIDQPLCNISKQQAFLKLIYTFRKHFRSSYKWLELANAFISGLILMSFTLTDIDMYSSLLVQQNNTILILVILLYIACMDHLTVCQSKQKYKQDYLCSYIKSAT